MYSKVIETEYKMTIDEEKACQQKEAKLCSVCLHMIDNVCDKTKDGKRPIISNPYYCSCSKYSHKEAYKSFPNAGDYDSDDVYNEKSDEYEFIRLLVSCPICNKSHFPFRGKSDNTTEKLLDGWRWVGLDYEEPFTTYKTICRKTGKAYQFTIYAPQ